MVSAQREHTSGCVSQGAGRNLRALGGFEQRFGVWSISCLAPGVLLVRLPFAGATAHPPTCMPPTNTSPPTNMHATYQRGAVYMLKLIHPQADSFPAEFEARGRMAAWPRGPHEPFFRTCSAWRKDGGKKVNVHCEVNVRLRIQKRKRSTFFPPGGTFPEKIFFPFLVTHIFHFWYGIEIVRRSLLTVWVPPKCHPAERKRKPGRGAWTLFPETFRQAERWRKEGKCTLRGKCTPTHVPRPPLPSTTT